MYLAVTGWETRKRPGHQPRRGTGLGVRYGMAPRRQRSRLRVWFDGQRWDGLRSGSVPYIAFLSIGITVIGFVVPMFALVLQGRDR